MTRKATINIGPTLDPFRSRQVPDVAGRFLKVRDGHQRHADLMWAGMLTVYFTDHELGLLNDLGYLSEHDLGLIRQANRKAGAQP